MYTKAWFKRCGSHITGYVNISVCLWQLGLKYMAFKSMNFTFKIVSQYIWSRKHSKSCILSCTCIHVQNVDSTICPCSCLHTCTFCIYKHCSVWKSLNNDSSPNFKLPKLLWHEHTCVCSIYTCTPVQYIAKCVLKPLLRTHKALVRPYFMCITALLKNSWTEVKK